MRAFKKELTMLGVMIALAIITAFLNPSSFLDADNLRNNIRHISLISLFALGEAVVIIAGGIDLSVGSIICLTAVATSYLTMVQGFGIVPAAVLALLLAVVIGLLQGAVIARLGVPPFVVTLGSMLLLRGVAEVLTGGSEIGFQGKFPGFRFLGEGQRPRVADAILVRAGGGRDRPPSSCTGRIFGRYCYAIGSNAEAARLSGVPVTAISWHLRRQRACSRASPGILYVAYLPAATPRSG